MAAQHPIRHVAFRDSACPVFNYSIIQPTILISKRRTLRACTHFASLYKSVRQRYTITGGLFGSTPATTLFPPVIPAAQPLASHREDGAHSTPSESAFVEQTISDDPTATTGQTCASLPLFHYTNTLQNNGVFKRMHRKMCIGCRPCRFNSGKSQLGSSRSVD